MEEVKLGTLTNRKIGYGIVQPGASVPNGIPVIKVNNVVSGLRDIRDLDTTTEEIDKKYLRTKLVGGELVISVVGTVGKTVIIPQSFAGCNLVRATAMIDILDPIMTYWVKYYIASPQGQHYIKTNLNTTVQFALNIKSLVDMPIPMFTSDYRRQVVEILKSFDDKIECNRRINDNLEQQAQALFKSWFVDFEPFRDQPFVESELGMIPQGWKVGTLGDIIEEKAKSTIQVKQAKDVKGDYPFFTSGSAILEFTEPLVMGRNLYLNTGGVAGVKYFIGNAAYSTDTWCICGRDDYSDYLYLYLKSNEDNLNSQYFEGSALKHLKKKALKSRSLILPTTTVINDFNKVVIPIFDKINSIFFQNRVLSQLRDTLLPRLMSGELKVQEIEESL